MTNNEHTKPDFPWEDGDFVVDTLLLGGIVDTLKPEAAVEVLDEWRERFVAVIDAAVTRYKSEVAATAVTND